MTAKYVEIPGSHRDTPTEGQAIAAAHAVAPGEQIEVSIYVKDREADPLLQQEPVTAQQAAAAGGLGATHPRDVSEQRANRYADDFAKITEFANEAGLSVVKTDPARRLIKLAGPVDKMEAAFRTKLHYYHDGERAFRARSGPLSAPADVVDSIEAVLGLDTRRIAKPKLRPHVNPHAIVGHLPNDVAKLYGFPATKGHGAGQCIAIVELGGGVRTSDTQRAFKAMGLKPPKVVAISVSGGANHPGQDTGADGEVALDVQVAGGAAPGATIAVYFAPNTDQGFVDAITRAVHDQQNRPSVISISWGSAEKNWTKQGLATMTSALRDAARMGVTVFAAAGDNLATDGVNDGRAHTDFPASSPYVVGCGGTLIDTASGNIVKETVWNETDSGTGGGISDVFPQPGYQKGIAVKSVNDGKVRRGVPDLGAVADPNSGFRVVVGGAGQTIGGTSGVAPLFAGLFALINEACGKPAGFCHPLLYGNANACRQITQGHNKDNGIGYDAGAGWNACTGLGAPVGQAILKVFQTAAGKSAASAAA
jgi:kumamolisin